MEQDARTLRDAAKVIEDRRLAKHGRMNFTSLVLVKVLHKIAASVDEKHATGEIARLGTMLHGHELIVSGKKQADATTSEWRDMLRFQLAHRQARMIDDAISADDVASGLARRLAELEGQ